MDHRVLTICQAYEQGYGMGLDNRDLENPYGAGDCYDAWDYGYQEGLSEYNLRWVTEEETSE